MKICLIIVLIFFVSHQTSGRNLNNLLVKGHETAQDLIEIKSEILIESIRDIVENGNNLMGIPALDPFTLSEQYGNLSSEMFTGEVEMNSANLIGISKFIVDGIQLKLNELIMNITLHWPILNLKLNSYNIDGEFYSMMPANGNGDAEFVIRDLKFSTEFPLYLNVKKQRFSIEEMKSNISLNNFEVISMDIINNDEEFTEMIKENIADQASEIVESLQEEIVSVINGYIMKNVNKILNEISIKKLIQRFTTASSLEEKNENLEFNFESNNLIPEKFNNAL